MNASVTLDKLIDQSNGNTLWFDSRDCPIELIKEAILRGFQCCNVSPLVTSEGCGEGEGWGCWGDLLGHGYGEGMAAYEGDGDGNSWDNPSELLGDGEGGGKGKMPLLIHSRLRGFHIIDFMALCWEKSLKDQGLTTERGNGLKTAYYLGDFYE